MDLLAPDLLRLSDNFLLVSSESVTPCRGFLYSGREASSFCDFEQLLLCSSVFGLPFKLLLNLL
jgi:hypothetical protein